MRGRTLYIKRDDLIDPLLSGNKYRKLYSLVHTPAEKYQRLTSFGGTQSNAMLSIAALCHQKGWHFNYTAKILPARLRQTPTGNLKQALDLGMQLHEVTPASYPNAITALRSDTDETCLLLAQGGADPLARAGLNLLAEEIRQWQAEQQIDALHVVTPSGTGTTACYLAQALPEAQILTTPAVGDAPFLIEQIERLNPMPANLHILESDKRYHFARPYPELLRTWQALTAANINVDLIYGTLMWHVLLQHLDNISGAILYLHSGGLSGNDTMLDRYRHKGLL